MQRSLWMLILSCGLGLAAHAQSSDLYEQTSEVNNLMVQFRADYGNLDRFYMIEASPDRMTRLQDIVKSYLGKVQELPYAQYNTGTKVDYQLFLRQLQSMQFNLQKEQQEIHSVAAWFPFADTIYQAERSRRRGTRPDAQAMALDFSRITRSIDTLKARLDSSRQTFTPAQLRRSQAITGGLQDALKSVYEFYNGYDPLFSWWIPEPYKKLTASLEAYGKAFKEKRAAMPGQQDDGSGIVGHPIGREELIRQLQVEMIDYTPEELVDIANKEFKWCDAEMLKASREMGFGDNWKAALEKVKNSYVPAGEQPEAMMKLYNESVDFLKSHDLVTIPPLAEETWRMIMMTPERQLVNPFFTGGEEFSISYPVSGMSEADKLMSMRGNNPHFSRATVHHELLAGHALQEFSTNRYKTYRHFETPFWIEGWSLYWEMQLWDLKFPASPEDRVGMLFWRMHRCARIIFSLNYHLGRWTPQQCIDFLVDRVGHERANAVGEVRRSFVGGYSPLYQVAYMIGGLEFTALKKELVDSGKMTARQYHDAVLHENMMPVEMLRAILEHKDIPKDYKTNWRFYNL
ncbi:DUF885 domain-containing protein [Chitinophaga parva]|uniref:DUF885 domain-containing protein n=1 Tax=Chitinophaga parva TaxID=2169414 RepID=A0A2T7BGL9_9BACT|nr:DUF885 family protein [Chitinophaga parva]PUZ25373.1 DUF885 domain-containing protein [Chitinophaga parva]